MENTPSLKWPKWVFVTLLMSFISCILLIADWTYWREYSLIRADKIGVLRNLSDIKSNDIMVWRNERIWDAQSAMDDPFLRNAVTEWVNHRQDSSVKRKIIEQLSVIFNTADYENAVLFSANGNDICSIHPLRYPLGANGRELISKSKKMRHIEFGDFTAGKAPHELHINIAAPILDTQNNPVAMLLVRITPNFYIYPLVKWSKSSESLLIQKHGDYAIILNSQRSASQSPTLIRIPNSATNSPTLLATRGETGIYEGEDYNGKSVLADIRHLPGTQWYLITQADKNEILADVRYWRDIVVIVTLLTMIVACIGTALLYIHHDRLLYRAYYHSEKERAAALEEIRATLYHIGDGVIATDAQGLIRRMNLEAERLTGWSECGVIGKPLEEVFAVLNESTRESLTNSALTAITQETFSGLGQDILLVDMNQTERPIAASGTPIRNSDGEITGVVLVFRDHTEERRRQAELLASETRYRKLFDSSPIPLLDMDLTRLDNHISQLVRSGVGDIAAYFKGRLNELKDCEKLMDVLNVNAAALKLFGVNSIAEFTENMARFFTDELHDIFLEGMVSVYSGNSRFQTDGVCRNLNGEIIPVTFSINAGLDAFEKTPHMVLALVDLSPFQQAKEARDASNRLFLQLFTNNVAPQLLLDIPTTKILDANAAAAQFFGYTIEELKRMCITDINTSSDAEVHSLVNNAATGNSNHFITKHRLASGEIRDVEILTSPFLYEDRIVLCPIIHDVTEQIRLQNHNQWLASIVEQTSNEVYAFDLQSLHFTYANRATIDNLGYTIEEMNNLTPLDIKPEYTLTQFETLLAPLLSDEISSLRFETIHKRKDGTTYPVLLVLQKKRLDTKDTIIAIGQDITEHKKMEDQLRQAQKMESVGRLAGGVAHDFNNMLGVILGLAEMSLEALIRGKPIQDNIKEILKAARRSADLTRQLLAFARRQTISPVVLDLNETMAGMLTMLRRLIGEDIELIWKPGSALWSVKIDPAQVDQALMNLVVNARDAISDVGSITIETSNVVFDESYGKEHAGALEGEYVLLAISDTGIGMDKNTLEHIFEPFFSTKDVGKGTGLGLAMIYGIVKQNHGYLTVYSEPGKGSCFKIYLPRTEETKADTDTSENRKLTEGAETVLVVEDEEAILNLSKDILIQQGYNVMAVSTTDEAIRCAESHPDPIDLLVTDIVMPGINGKELADRIRDIRPEIKVLFMSGYTASVVEHRGVLDKGMHYLQKPFSIRTFAEKVRETLDA